MAFLAYLFSFKGRVNRAKMWGLYGVLFAAELVLIGVIAAIDAVAPGTGISIDGLDSNPVANAVFVVFIALASWASLAVMIKRLHDRDRAWWWFPVFFVLPALPLAATLGAMAVMDIDPNAPVPNRICIVGYAIAVVFQIWGFIELYFLRGTAGPNRFGPDPVSPIEIAILTRRSTD